MAIKAIPTVSAPIYLGDVSDEVSKLEGNCQDADRAWVVVRQGTEGDNRRRADIESKFTLRWNKDGSADEVRDVNRRELWAFEVYSVLCGVGNIFSDEAGTKPLFSFKRGKDYDSLACDFEEFKTLYGELPSVVTNAMLRAAYQLNPDWDWMPTKGEA